MSREWLRGTKEDTIKCIEKRLTEIDATDFFVNIWQGNGYYPIERFILLEDKYIRCWYKTTIWKVVGCVDAKDIAKTLFMESYAIATLPTNDFNEVVQGTDDYRTNIEKAFPTKFRLPFKEDLFTKEDLKKYLEDLNPRE